MIIWWMIIWDDSWLGMIIIMVVSNIQIIINTGIIIVVIIPIVIIYV